MAVYCASTGVTPYLPSSHGISSFTDIIAAATSWVDSRLSPKYWTFPDINSTPATPACVRKPCEMYAAYLALTQLGPSNRFADMSHATMLRDGATMALNELVDEKFPVQVPLSSVANEDISLGAVGEANQHYFACTPRDIVPGSVVVTNQAGTTFYSRDVDFTVSWSHEHRGWMLNIVSSLIIDDDHVAYDYSHLKRREIDAPPGHDAVVIVRA